MGMPRNLLFLMLPLLLNVAGVDVLDLLHGATTDLKNGAQGSWEKSGKHE